jgi:hypothetical protein
MRQNPPGSRETRVKESYPRVSISPPDAEGKRIFAIYELGNNGEQQAFAGGVIDNGQLSKFFSKPGINGYGIFSICAGDPSLECNNWLFVQNKAGQDLQLFNTEGGEFGWRLEISQIPIGVDTLKGPNPLDGLVSVVKSSSIQELPVNFFDHLGKGDVKFGAIVGLSRDANLVLATGDGRVTTVATPYETNPQHIPRLARISDKRDPLGDWSLLTCTDDKADYREGSREYKGQINPNATGRISDFFNTSSLIPVANHDSQSKGPLLDDKTIGGIVAAGVVLVGAALLYLRKRFAGAGGRPRIRRAAVAPDDHVALPVTPIYLDDATLNTAGVVDDPVSLPTVTTTLDDYIPNAEREEQRHIPDAPDNPRSFTSQNQRPSTAPERNSTTEVAALGGEGRPRSTTM